MMNNESFAMVFAPTYSEVQKQCDEHRRSEKIWLVIALCLAGSVIFCLRMFLGDLGNPTTNILVARLVFIGTLIDLAGVVAAVIAMIYHGAKAERFEQELDNYITFRR